MIYVFAAHVLLLILASGGLSTAPSWSLWVISYENGFGHAYVSQFSTGQILLYPIAYGLGFPAFAYAGKRGWKWLAVVGVGLCLLGFLSFAIEASHLVLSHNLSLIVSLPVVMVVLWICWIVMFVRTRATPQQEN
jgi:hypothetical protein